MITQMTDTASVDAGAQNTYNKAELERIVSSAVGQAIAQYEAQRTHLENRIESKDNFSAMGILTVDELADLLKVSRPVAYELVGRADFPSFRIGKSIRIHQAGLADWISHQAAAQKG